MRFEKTQRTCQAIKQKTDVTNVGGGTSTAGPWDGEPTNDGNKAETPPKDLTYHEYANMVNMQNMHIVQYAN